MSQAIPPDPARPASTRRALRIIRVAGIDVYVHWAWLVVGVIELQFRADSYSNLGWNIAEYLSLFGIVLLHEFGHALACRSVGGQANTILLWPLGGVAYVRAPQRPGAQLWSIVAGPLVNVVLVPITLGAFFAVGMLGLGTDAETFALNITLINGALLVFNMLPFYPLDGGQALRSVLWFGVGRERSLLFAAGVGLFAAVMGGVAALLWLQDFWIVAIAAYAGWHSWQAFKLARARQTILSGPRHPDRACPGCGDAPIQGAFLQCPTGHVFDPYGTGGACPGCDFVLPQIACLACSEVFPTEAFGAARAAVFRR